MHVYRDRTCEYAMSESYLRNHGQSLVAEVPQGYPHGDAWTRIVHPEATPTHDTERYLIAQARKQKKERS